MSKPGFITRWMAGLVAEILNRYEGAQFSTSRSMISGSLQSARFDATQSTREELVRKSRYFEKNNPILNKMADLFECYTVGSGVPMMPASSSESFNDAATVWLGPWSRYCDLTSLSGFATIQSLIARTWFIDGEIFIYMTKGKGGIPRIQLIEGHRIKTPPALAKMEGESVVDGVAIDPTGRPVGYWVAKDSQDRRTQTFDYISADDMFHVFEQSRPQQYRGLPFCYPVINELHDLDDLHLLEMKAAKVLAKVAIVQKTKTGDPINAENLLKGSFSQSVKTATGTTSSETRQQYYDNVFGNGGDHVTMRTGDEMATFMSNRPSVVTTDYWKYKTELVTTGCGFPYVIVFPDSMQGTTYRGSLEMADAFFCARFSVLRTAFEWIYEKVMRWASQTDPKLRENRPEDWFKVSMLPPRSVNVDVGRNSSAMLAELAVGATNYEQIYAPLGLDWKTEFKKLAAQKEFAKKIGLELNPDANQQQDENQIPAAP